MKVLAIRFARLGDVLLLLPALASFKEKMPESTLVLLTGHRCAPIAKLCPAIDEVISVDRISMRDGPVVGAIRQMLHLLRDIRRERFDAVIDFHSFRETNLLTWLSGAPVRLGLKRERAPYWKFCFTEPGVVEDKSLHVSEMFERVIAELPSPGYGISPRGKQPVLRVPDYVKNNQKLALFVDAPVPDRIWAPDRFAKVADFAVERLNARVTVISSKAGADLAMRVRGASAHSQGLEVLTDLTLPELASVIASARLLVSNDTGPMHIGPAVGTMTLGLFSVGYPEHFHPIGEQDRYLRAIPIDKIAVNDVIANVGEMWSIAADPDPRC
jgi:ADP-heptose:LPS heptosyltransferase